MTNAKRYADLLGQLAEPFTAEALFDCLPDVVFFIKNGRGEYVVVSRSLVERCGRRAKAELIGRTADEVFPSPLGSSYKSQDEDVLKSGQPILDQLELHFYPTGQCGWCVTNKLPLLASNGAVVGLYGVSKDVQLANERSEDFSAVARAVRRIHEDYGRPLHVGELASEAGLSVYQFEQRIRRIFHLTAGQLIQKVRLENALSLLVRTSESIAAISSKCGYSDQSAFTRKFRETVGLSPSEYRRSVRDLKAQPQRSEE